MPKVQKLNRAKQFTYARNLNAELIGLFWHNTTLLQNTGLVFEGATFEDTLDKLQTLRDNVYTTETFKQLVGKQKTKGAYVLVLQQSIDEQIQMQQQIKAQFNKLMYRYRIAA